MKNLKAVCNRNDFRKMVRLLSRHERCRLELYTNYPKDFPGEGHIQVLCDTHETCLIEIATPNWDTDDNSILCITTGRKEELKE